MQFVCYFIFSSVKNKRNTKHIIGSSETHELDLLVHVHVYRLLLPQLLIIGKQKLYIFIIVLWQLLYK